MWRIIYTIGVYLAFPFFTLFALTKKKIWRTFFQRLYIRKAPAMQDVIWIHAASVGEAIIAENFVHYMSRRSGFRRFAITTNTDYTHGMLSKRLGENVHILYLPFDLPFVIKRFMKGSTFRGLILIETELWPNLIWAAHARGTPVIVMNGRISDRTVKRYRSLSFFLRHVLLSIDLVLAQSQIQAERFISIGMDAERVVDVGNLKYYRFLDYAPGTTTKENIITFGSIKEKELPIVLPLIAPLMNAFPGHSIYLAPRDLSLVDTIEQKLSGSLRVLRFSGLKKNGDYSGEIVIVDTMGDLMSIYSRSLLAFVGGSLAPYGGQNIMEPLFFATPVLFGPHIENFAEMADKILAAGAGVLVHSGRELFDTITDLLNNFDLRRQMGNAGLQIIKEQEAVLAKSVSLITERLWKNSPALQN
jgi:3-deoxy-D-manno-octulosonic-acid transferase